MAERQFNEQLSILLQEAGYGIILPQEECFGLTPPQHSKEIFNLCKQGVEECDIVVAILDGANADSGTCFEVGMAYAMKKPIIGIRTDLRKSGDDNGLNLMLTQSCETVVEEYGIFGLGKRVLAALAKY